MEYNYNIENKIIIGDSRKMKEIKAVEVNKYARIQEDSNRIR